MSPPGVEVGHRAIGSISLPLLKSLPRACPAQHPDWEVPETGAMEGTVCDSCCWGTSGEGMEWKQLGGSWPSCQQPEALLVQLFLLVLLP